MLRTDVDVLLAKAFVFLPPRNSFALSSTAISLPGVITGTVLVAFGASASWSRSYLREPGLRMLNAAFFIVLDAISIIVVYAQLLEIANGLVGPGLGVLVDGTFAV